MSEKERLLPKGIRVKELARGPYQDTKIRAAIHGPDVTENVYRERVKITKLNPDQRSSVFGWHLVEIPTDPEAINQFIQVLEEARDNLERERSLRADRDPEETTKP